MLRWRKFFWPLFRSGFFLPHGIHSELVQKRVGKDTWSVQHEKGGWGIVGELGAFFRRMWAKFFCPCGKGANIHVLPWICSIFWRFCTRNFWRCVRFCVKPDTALVGSDGWNWVPSHLYVRVLSRNKCKIGDDGSTMFGHTLSIRSCSLLCRACFVKLVGPGAGVSSWGSVKAGSCQGNGLERLHASSCLSPSNAWGDVRLWLSINSYAPRRPKLEEAALRPTKIGQFEVKYIM